MFGCQKYTQFTFIVLQISTILLIFRDATSGHVLRSRREVIDSGANHPNFNQNRNESFAINRDHSLSHDVNNKDDASTFRITSTSSSTTDVNNAIADGQSSHENSANIPPKINEKNIENDRKKLPLQSSHASTKSDEDTTILWTTERTTTENLTSSSKSTSIVPETSSTSTEKRAKILHDTNYVTGIRSPSRDTDEKWIDLKPVSEVDHNNVTFHRIDDSKIHVDSHILQTTNNNETINAEESVESQLHANNPKPNISASPMDDNTHQNISSLSSNSIHSESMGTTKKSEHTTTTTTKQIPLPTTTPAILTSLVPEGKSTIVPTDLTTIEDDISTVTEKQQTTVSRPVQTLSKNATSTSHMAHESFDLDELSTLPTTTPSMTTLSNSNAEETTQNKPSFTETTEGFTSTKNSAEDLTTIDISTVKFVPINSTTPASVSVPETTESIVHKPTNTAKNEVEKLTEPNHASSSSSTTIKQEHNEIETGSTEDKKSEQIIAVNTNQNQPVSTIPYTIISSSTVSSAAPIQSNSTITTTTSPSTMTPMTPMNSSTSTTTSTTTTTTPRPTSSTTVTIPTTSSTTESVILNTKQTTEVTQSLESGSDGNPEPHSDDGKDINAMIAGMISIVSVITLILLVGFLVVMRKRQKQLTYGQRCRPVGLDAYSLDNISVFNSVRRKSALRASKGTYGNAAFDDPALKNNILNMSQLATFVQKRSAIYEEFSDVPMVTARIDEVPPGCEDKNRYANVVPLPESRVPLEKVGDDDTTEYINANFVKGPKDTTHYYIACQAPLENTITDFWRMIWEQDSRVIIMATDLTENGIEKCAEYLPPSFVIDNHVTFGDFDITLKNREVRDKYAVSTIHLKNNGTRTWREITHLWYQWPETGVPGDEASVIAMLLEARSYLKMAAPEQTVTDDNDPENDTKFTNGNIDKTKSFLRVQGPLTIHCSPGTARTGTIIACDIAIRTLEQPSRSVDIPQIVYLIRRGRASAVQTREQYEFIYKVSHVYATKLTGPTNDN